MVWPFLGPLVKCVAPIACVIATSALPVARVSVTPGSSSSSPSAFDFGGFAYGPWTEAEPLTLTVVSPLTVNDSTGGKSTLGLSRSSRQARHRMPDRVRGGGLLELAQELVDLPGAVGAIGDRHVAAPAHRRVDVDALRLEVRLEPGPTFAPALTLSVTAYVPSLRCATVASTPASRVILTRRALT